MGFGAIGLVGGLLSTGMSIYGQQQQGKSAMAAARYNNELAQREADNLEKEGTENIARQRINNRKNLASLRVRNANSGTVANSGTTSQVLEDAAGTLEVGIADAARSANMQAASVRQQGEMGIWNAKQQKSALHLKSIATGLRGLTKAAGTAYGNYRVGSR
jgi:hypothetical protein